MTVEFEAVPLGDADTDMKDVNDGDILKTT